MTVRWKPLLILSGVFAFIAVVGVVAITYAMKPRGSVGMLRDARAFRAAKRYSDADIHFQRALQVEGKNPAIHEERAAMFADWVRSASSEQQPNLRVQRLKSLADAAKFGKTLKEPRRALLASAMEQDEVPEGIFWAKEVLVLEPNHPDALYFLASESLEGRAPNVPEIKRQLATLAQTKAPEVRLEWVKARLAQAAQDVSTRETVLARSRKIVLPETAGPVDRTAMLRLRALDVETTTETAILSSRVKALQTQAKAFASEADVAPNRIMRLSLILENVQKSLSTAAAKAESTSKTEINGLVDAIEQDVETIFRRALAVAKETDLHVYLIYADHLRFRNQRDRCLDVVGQALKSKLAKLSTSTDVVNGLHSVAVESALSDTKDIQRFEKAGPHIKELLASPSSRFQGLGHLFQGAIELEQSGVAGAASGEGGRVSSVSKTNPQPKLRASALNHLKLAAAQLPDVVEAQARYGVALILGQEMGLGRQYLQNAIRLGNTDPQYQLWAAWSMVQAGYPEEAEPIVNHLSREIAQGRMPRDMEATLHLLNGEIHQARRESPAELKQALAEYERSYEGKVAPASVQLRMAQIDVQLNQRDKALQRIQSLRSLNQAGATGEQLAILILNEQGKTKEAHDTLSAARKAFPGSEELVGLEAALLSKEKKFKEADKALSDFLDREPENLGVALMRAQLLSDELGDVKEARRLLVNVADRSENSSPLVQLALLDLKQKDYDAVSATIAKIRARWKEAAAADLLEAQLAIEQGNLNASLDHFEVALKKDPGNKIVQFWKAQIESRVGASQQATEGFESLIRDGSSKRLESGITIPAASQSALANLALQTGNVDAAISKFESLRAGGLTRTDRWQLAAAYAAKNQWPLARKEIAALLNDPKNPPDSDERVQAANFYRVNQDSASAIAQLDYVLATDPGHPGTVVTRAYMFSQEKKTAEAMVLLRRAIDWQGKEKPPAIFFMMLAAFENITPPRTDAGTRAMKVLNEGLKIQPHAVDLVQTKYQLMLISNGRPAAVAFLEAEAKAEPTGVLPGILAEAYRNGQEYDKAEKTIAELVAKNPKDAKAAALLVRITAEQAARAGERNDREGERSLNEKTASLIRGFREIFPNELSFLKEDCELALRRGDVAKATAITKQVDLVAKNSPVAPILRARLFALQDRFRDAADAYNEALRRNPNQPDTRLMLAQTYLRLNEPDEAIREAKNVLENDPNRVEAIVVEARALALPGSNPFQSKSKRAQAIERLRSVLKSQPKLSPIYHEIAEIQIQDDQRAAAVATLRAALDAVADDPIAIAQVIEILAAPVRGSAAPSPDDFSEAQAMATNIAMRDTKGALTLAVAVGFHKARQLELAETWIAKAAAKLDDAILHLHYGDILLSLAEREGVPAEQAKVYFRRSVEQYDLVLKTQANSIEAINNKAWILHSYLGESRNALEVAEALIKRVDPTTLPGEFYDTMGAIQESMGKARDAEQSYVKGLGKSPEHPVLNYHMGRLMLGDPKRADKARPYLEKAFKARDRMNPAMAAEVTTLLQRLTSVRAN